MSGDALSGAHIKHLSPGGTETLPAAWIHLLHSNTFSVPPRLLMEGANMGAGISQSCSSLTRIDAGQWEQMAWQAAPLTRLSPRAGKPHLMSRG